MRIDHTDRTTRPATAGSRANARLIRHWQFDSERRYAIRDFIAARGEMGCANAVLCALYWIEHVDGRTDATLQTTQTPEQPADRPVSASEISALYDSHAGRRLRGVAGFLTRLARGALVETAGGGWYHTTALGRAVVHAFPNHVEVARLRHMRVRGARRGV